MDHKRVILHLTSLTVGGGGVVTMNIHHCCLEYGYESYVVIRGKTCIFPDGSQKAVKSTRLFLWNKFWRFVFRWIGRHSQIDSSYSMYNLCERFTCFSAKDILTALPQKPDIIFVHWVSDFANAKVIHDLKQLTGAKVLFLLVDHALYSGGCHYQLDCQGYIDGCHNCPATKSLVLRWGIEKNYAFKKKYLPKDSYIAARGIEVSRLKESSIYKDFPQALVVFPVDEKKYCPSHDRGMLRGKWGIPSSRKVVMIGATDLRERRKGIFLLTEALRKVKTDVLVMVVGKNEPAISYGKETVNLGYLAEDQLIEAYQMADVFVCPSLADSGPLMVKQACLCGIPVVAFPVGASVELVESGETGYLAKYGDVEDLAFGIDMIVSLSTDSWREMSLKCRSRSVQLFSFQAGNTIEDLMNKLFS